MTAEQRNEIGRMLDASDDPDQGSALVAATIRPAQADDADGRAYGDEPADDHHVFIAVTTVDDDGERHDVVTILDAEGLPVVSYEVQ